MRLDLGLMIFACVKLAMACYTHAFVLFLRHWLQWYLCTCSVLGLICFCAVVFKGMHIMRTQNYAYNINVFFLKTKIQMAISSNNLLPFKAQTWAVILPASCILTMYTWLPWKMKLVSSSQASLLHLWRDFLHYDVIFSASDLECFYPCSKLNPVYGYYTMTRKLLSQDCLKLFSLS